MNHTPTFLQEVMLRCREYIHDGTIAIICLISSLDNLEDAMTKIKPNQRFFNTLIRNKLINPLRRVFMLLTCSNRHLDFISTISVPIHSDKTIN